MNPNDVPLSHSIEWLAILCDLLIKGAVLLFAAGLITMVMRKASAAARHLIWAIALGGVLVLPLFSAVVPGLRLPVLPTFTTSAPGRASVSHEGILPARAPAASRSRAVTAGASADHIGMPPPRPVVRASVMPHVNAIAGTRKAVLAVTPIARKNSITAAISHWTAIHWPLLLLVTWLAGVAMIGLIGLLGYLRPARRLARARIISTGPIALLAAEICRELKLDRPVRLAIDDGLLIPLAHGVFRPRVLLPAAAESWPDDKLRAVLLHELAHVARWDCASLLIGQIACTLHWPDPLVWLGWRRLRSECERACDDAVLRCSTGPADYAENLLAIARELRSAAMPLSASLAMARPSELKGRIIAILDERRNRRPIPVGRAVAMLAAGMLMAASFAALHLQGNAPVHAAQPNNTHTAIAPVARRKTMTLTVIDKQTGKPLAGVKVHAIIHNEVVATRYTGALGTAALPLPRNNSSIFLVRVLPRNCVHIILEWLPHIGKPRRIPNRYVLAVARGTSISGRVVDDAGKPVAQAHVRLVINAHGISAHAMVDWSPITVLTDADGVWHYDGVPSHGVTSITIGAWDYKYVWGSSLLHLQTFKNLVPLRSGTARSILQHGVMVHGVVRTPGGKPLAGAKVLVAPWRSGINVPTPIETDTAGRFSFAANPGQSVVLTATAKGFGAAFAEFVMAHKPRSISLKLTAPQVLAGRVVNQNGMALVGTGVYVDGWRGYRTLAHNMRTDGHGRFLWRNAPAGKILVNIKAQGAYPFTIDVPVWPGKPNVITLHPQVAVHGTVTDASTGKPIRKFTIIRGCIFASAQSNPRTPQQISWNQMNPKTITGDGHFVYTMPIQRAAYAIRIEASGYLPSDSRLFHNNKRQISLSFKLVPSRDISATVLNPNGTPAAGAKAVLVPARRTAIIGFGTWSLLQGDIRSQVDAHGHLRFTPQRGAYLLAIYNRMGYAVRTRNNLQKSSTVVLRKWVHIRGTLLFGSKPAPGRKVEATISMHWGPNKPGPYYHGTQWQSSTTTDGQGRFLLSQVPAGTGSIAMTISQEPAGGPSYMGSTEFSQPLVAKAGRENHIILGGVGRTVEGTVEVPKSLAHRRDWYFQIGNVMTRSRQLPMPANIKHGTSAEQLAWLKAFASTAKGKATLIANQKWWETHAHSYGFIVKPDRTFIIHNVLPGNYRIYLSAVRILHPRAVGIYSDIAGRVIAAFTVPPIPGGVTDVPLRIPPLKLVPVTPAKAADPPALAPAAKTPPTIKTVPAMALTPAPHAAPTPKTMTLTVIDKQTGKPLAGVVVKVWNGPALRTAANGTVEIPVPKSFPASAMILTIKRPSYVPMELTWNSQNGWAGRIPSRYTLKMWRGKTISGRVDDDAGNPIAGAHVQVWWDVKPQASTVKRIDAYPVSTVTDGQGFWHCTGVPVAHLKAVRLGVWDYKYVWDLSPATGAIPAGYLPLRKFTDFRKLLDGRAVYILQRGTMVHGVVLGPQGKSVPGAKVALGYDRIATNVPPPMVADKHGRFAFAVKPGQWVIVTATAKGYGPILKKFIAEKNTSSLAITLTPPHTLAGLVVGPSGRPIAGAWVFTDRWRGCRTLVHTMRTDHEGRFIWNNAPADQVLVNAQAAGFAYSQDTAIRAGDENRITLHYQVTVHGTVVDARTGKPIHKFQVIGGMAQDPVNPGTAPEIFWNTRFPREVVDDGHFIYRPWGQWPLYAIRIRAPGYGPVDSKAFTNTVRNVYLRFKLTPARNISATILNPNGTPAAGAKALLVPAGQGATIGFKPFAVWQQNVRSVTNRHGLLSFPSHTGDYQIAVYDHDGYAVVTRDNFTKSKFVRLLPWGEIHGRLLFGTKPAPGQTVEINSPAGSNGPMFKGIQWSRLEVTNSNGEFICNQLPAGKVSVRLVLWQPGSGTLGFMKGGGLNHTVTIQSGKISDVALGGRGRCVVGRVIIPSALSLRGHWHFGIANASTKGPALPMPKNIRHSTHAIKNNWARVFFKSPKGKAWISSYDRWARMNSRIYPFFIKPDGHFLIPDVVPGTYRMMVAIVNGAKPTPMIAYIHVPVLATVKATFTVPPIPGGVTDVPLKIPPLKIVFAKSTKR